MAGNVPVFRPSSATRVAFIRTAPLAVTPAVERYVGFLRGHVDNVKIVGIEFQFRLRPEPNDFCDVTSTYRFASRRLQGSRAMVAGLPGWQLFVARELVRQRADVIQFADVFCALPALAVGLGTRARLVFDIRDNVGPSIQHRSRTAARVLAALERHAATRADAVVVMTESRKEFLPPALRPQALVIPNAPLTDRFRGFQPRASARLRINLSAYVSLQRNLDALCPLVAADPRIELDVYGTATDDQTRRALAGCGVVDLPKLRSSEALSRLAESDVVALMYDPEVELCRHADPNKYYEALMMGKPVLAARGMALGEEVASAGAGLVVAYGDRADLRRALEVLLHDDARRAMARAARQLFEQRYLGAADIAMTRLYSQVGLRVRPG